MMLLNRRIEKEDEHSDCRKRRIIKEAIDRRCRVLFSSDAVYGDISGYIYTEDSNLKVMTPHGRMKRSLEERIFDGKLTSTISKL